MNKHHRIHRQRRTGFTLLELVIAIALLMIVMLMVMMMFQSAQSLYRIASERSEVFSQGRVALDIMERDIQRASKSNFANFIALSHSPEFSSPVAGADKPFDPMAYGKLFLETPDETRPDNETTSRIIPVLTLNVDATDWTDSKGELQSGPAQVTYYLKKRGRISDGIGESREPVTAYLVRYVVPIRFSSSVPAERSQDMGGSQTEVANSILAVRIWAYNNAAPAYMAQKRREYELFPRIDRVPTPSAMMLRDAAGVDPNENRTEEERRRLREQSVLSPVDIRPGVTYSWGFSAGSRIENVSSRGSFPMAIAIELTIANDQVMVVDNKFQGTVRTVRRMISVPNTLPAAALTDKEIEDWFKS